MANDGANVNLGSAADVLTPIVAPIVNGAQQYYLPLGTSGYPPGYRQPGWGAITSAGDDPAGAGGRALTPGVPTTPPNVCWLATVESNAQDADYFWWFLGSGHTYVTPGQEDVATLFLPKPPPGHWWTWQADGDNVGYPLFYTTGGTGTVVNQNNGPGGLGFGAAPIGCRWVKAPADAQVSGTWPAPALLIYDGSDGGNPHPSGATCLAWGADAYGAPSAGILDFSNPPDPTSSAYELPTEIYTPQGPGGFYSQDNGLNFNESGTDVSNLPLPNGYSWTKTSAGLVVTTTEDFGDWLVGQILTDIDAIADIEIVTSALQGQATDQNEQPGQAFGELLGNDAGLLTPASALNTTGNAILGAKGYAGSEPSSTLGQQIQQDTGVDLGEEPSPATSPAASPANDALGYAGLALGILAWVLS